MCIGLAVLSALCFLCTGLFSPREVAQVKQRIEFDSIGNGYSAFLDNDNTNEVITVKKNLILGLTSCWQIIRERDFLCVVLALFFRIMRTTAAANFTAIFVEALVSPTGLLPKGSNELSIFYQLSQTLPPVSALAKKNSPCKML